MSRVECIVANDAGGRAVEVVLMEPRPFRPFKSSEEYLIAMKEDLAEWLQRLYQLDIDAESFMHVLEDGVVLCKHANNVRRTAVAYKEKLEQQGRHRSRKFSTHVEVPDRDVLYRAEVKSNSFFARDNVHNFIQWCRLLGIYECLLFETDDLVLRKNEKSVILCLLEVARRGTHFGMPAPMLVRFEKEIEREMAKEEGAGEADDYEEEEDDEDAGVEYGPHAQIVTNDLRSLDEMVRDLVEICSCPTQFPMIRISEGKYRIGDTKMLIFVRVLRNHVMVRVGGGWDTLSHYLEKHDPCRCRAGHRSTVASKLSVTQSARGSTQMAVSYERAISPPTSRRSSSASNGTLPSSRKNSIAGSVASPIYSSPHSPFESHLRQRSTSPSIRAPGRASGNQSPGKSPVPQRRQLLPSPPDSTHGNLDSLESYDSGISFERRSNKRGQQRATDSNSSDSSSEVSDDGYRTMNQMASDERPDSSCTQNSTSAESGVSSASSTAKEKPVQPSRIPFLGSLRGRASAQRNADEPGSRPASRPTSRRNSVNEDTPTPAQQTFNRSNFGRHSLRLRNTSIETPRTPLLRTPRIDPPKSGTLAWRSRRERPVLNSETFSATPGHRSRSMTCRSGASRANSTSPGRRRTGNSSIPSSPEPTNLNWKSGEQQHKCIKKEESPLKSMLKDLENDSEASILKKMEEIVNQYKARVETILAAEGKTLDESWDEPRKPLIQFEADPLNERPQRHLSRRRSFDSGLSQMAVRPRKDPIASSPSKIPVPMFYRSKEACL